MRIRNPGKNLATALMVTAMLACTQPSAKPARVTYAGNSHAEAFIDEMVGKHEFDRNELNSIFSQAEKRDDILELMSRPAEKKLKWFEYRKIFLTESRISGGVSFWQNNREALERASKAYGVDPQIIVAIIGVETRYGSNTGRHRVLDALSTLAFDYPPRSAFFRSELEQFLVLAREEQIDLIDTTGSYAGAMGYGQFIPSSYRHYAVDFDGDGRRDLWDSKLDIIGSVANYFSEHGWKSGEPVTALASVQGSGFRPALEKGYKPNQPLGDLRNKGVMSGKHYPDGLMSSIFQLDQENGPEYWIGFDNFYVITRYNHSPMYAMAVYQLSEEISAAYAGTLAEAND